MLTVTQINDVLHHNFPSLVPKDQSVGYWDLPLGNYNLMVNLHEGVIVISLMRQTEPSVWERWNSDRFSTVEQLQVWLDIWLWRLIKQDYDRLQLYCKDYAEIIKGKPSNV